MDCARANRGAAGLHLAWLATRLDLTRFSAGLHRTGLRSHTGLHLTGLSGLNHTRFGWGTGLDHARLCRPARLHRPRFSRSAARRHRLTQQGRFHRLDLFVGRQLLDLRLLLRG